MLPSLIKTTLKPYILYNIRQCAAIMSAVITPSPLPTVNRSGVPVHPAERCEVPRSPAGPAGARTFPSPPQPLAGHPGYPAGFRPLIPRPLSPCRLSFPHPHPTSNIPLALIGSLGPPKSCHPVPVAIIPFFLRALCAYRAILFPGEKRLPDFKLTASLYCEFLITYIKNGGNEERSLSPPPPKCTSYRATAESTHLT